MMLRHARTTSDFQAFNGKIDYGPLAEILLMQDPSWKEGLSGQHRGTMSRRRFMSTVACEH